MAKVDLIGWQFVRIMVFLEEKTGGGKPAPGSLYDDWKEEWRAFDARLERLGETDVDGFSHAMMAERFTFPDVKPHQMSQLLRAIKGVIDQMRFAIETEEDEEMASSLKFEQIELRKLRDRLQNIQDGTPEEGKQGGGKQKARPGKQRGRKRGQRPGKGHDRFSATRPGANRSSAKHPGGKRSSTKRPGGKGR